MTGQLLTNQTANWINVTQLFEPLQQFTSFVQTELGWANNMYGWIGIALLFYYLLRRFFFVSVPLNHCAVSASGLVLHAGDHFSFSSLKTFKFGDVTTNFLPTFIQTTVTEPVNLLCMEHGGSSGIEVSPRNLIILGIFHFQMVHWRSDDIFSV